MKYQVAILTAALFAALPATAQIKVDGAAKAQVQANPRALERANVNSTLKRSVQVPQAQTPTVPVAPALATPAVPTTPALVGQAKQGRNAVTNTLFGITPDAKGRFDINGDGSISNDEIQAYNRIRAAVQSGTTGAKFKAIDTNADGILSLEEMQAFRSTLNRAPAINLGIRANSQGQFDFDGDGTISTTEASASVRVQAALQQPDGGLFRQIDANADRILSAEELRAFSLLPTL